MLLPAALLLPPLHRPLSRCTVQNLATAEETPRFTTTANGLSVRDISTGKSVDEQRTVTAGDVVTIQFSGELLSRRTRYVGVGLREQPWQADERRETFEIGSGRAAL